MTVEAPILQDQHKPGKVQTIAILTLISGISNILWPLFLYSVIGASTLFIGCLALPLFAPPIVLGVFEIIYAAKLLPTSIKAVKASPTIAVLEIVCALTGNLLAVAAGIVALIFYSEPEVKVYFAKFAPTPAAPKPAATPDVPPAPIKAKPTGVPIPAESEAPAMVAETIVPAAVEPAATVIAMPLVTPSAPEPEQPKPVAPATSQAKPVKATQPKPAKKPASAKPAAKAAPKAKSTKPASTAPKAKPSKSAKKPAAPKASKPGS